MFKPKYYIVYSRKMINEIKWPDYWGNQCSGVLPDMLKEKLNVKSIGSEIKLIWNERHRWQVIKDNDIEYEDLENYLKADCSILSFQTEFMMNRTYKALELMGAKSLIKVDNYRDVILQQAHFKQFGIFIVS